VDGDFGAEFAGFFVSRRQDGFIFPQFGFADNDHRAVVLYDRA
jgi:hypothetical protein